MKITNENHQKLSDWCFNQRRIALGSYNGARNMMKATVDNDEEFTYWLLMSETYWDLSVFWQEQQYILDDYKEEERR